MNIPNILTISRFVMTLGFLYFFSKNILIASLLFVLAAVTDFFDGYLARKYNLITPFGKIMDPIADKFLILSGFALFALAGFVYWWMFWIIAVREIGVTLFRFWAVSKGKVLAAEQAGKVKTVLQISTICLMLLLLMLVQFGFEGLWQIPVILIIKILAIVLLWLSVAVTLLSGISVIWNNRKLFNSNK